MLILPKCRIEEALKRGRIAAEDMRVEGWPAVGQWSRWARTEIGLLLDAIIKGRIADSHKERQRALAKRVRAMDRIAALPCGFAHAVPSAVRTAVKEMKPILRALGDDMVNEGKDRFDASLQRRFVHQSDDPALGTSSSQRKHRQPRQASEKP